MTRLLVAHDGSTAADAAVTTAGGLFPGARGRVLNVYDPPPDFGHVSRHSFGFDAGELKRHLDALATESVDAARGVAAIGAASGATVGMALQPSVAEGSASVWSAILSAADDIDADAIVCGSRGRGGAARSLLGSTSSSVLHHSRRPVLVVPAPPAVVDGPAMIAYDGSPGARAAIAGAGRLLSGRRAMIVNVWSSPIRHTLSGRAVAATPLITMREFVADYEKMFAEAADDVVDEGVSLARGAGLEASGHPIESAAGAWRAIAEAANEHNAAVIVAGSRGRGSVASALLGSVSSGLVHNAQTPTLIVAST